MRQTFIPVGVLALAFTAIATSADAQLVRIGPGSFTPGAPAITFSEVALGTLNPTFSFNLVPDIGDITVSFAGAFQGQTVTGGGVRTLSGNPTNPLALNLSEQVSTVTDGAAPNSPVLSGSPTFNGPVVIYFSKPVAFVALDGGFFDAIGGTSITGYRADGSALGTFTNDATGIETFGFADAGGANSISGLAFYITGNEPAGFAIDNVRFGGRADLVNVVPEPSTYAMLALGLGAMAGMARRRRQTQA